MSFLTNDEVQPLLNQTVTLHILRYDAGSSVVRKEKVTLGPLPTWFTLYELKLALWNLKGKDPVFSPSLVFLALAKEKNEVGDIVYYSPADLVWMSPGGSSRKDVLDLIPPISLMTGPVDSRFVDSAGGRKPLTMDNRMRMTLSDVFQLEEGKTIPEFYVTLYADLVERIVGPRPLSEKDVFGRLIPYFPLLDADSLPPSSGFVTADLQNQAKQCDESLKKLAYLDELLITLGGDLKIPSLNGVKLLRLLWSQTPPAWEGPAPLFFGIKATHERPYLRFFPSSGSPLTKIRVLGDQTSPIPDLSNPSILTTWKQDKNPAVGQECVFIKLLIQASVTADDVPIFATQRIFQDGTSDLILLPPKQKRLLDPESDLQEAPEAIEKAMELIPYLNLQASLGQADVVFRLRLQREDSKVTRESLLQRLPCFSSVFQEIPPLPDEQSLITLRFKGVSNFVNEDRVFTFLTQLQTRESVAGETEVTKWAPIVASEFQIPIEEARKQIVAWIAQRNEYSLAVPETKDFILTKNPGIDISIFSQHPTYTFHVSRIQSFKTYSILKNLLGLFVTAPTDRFPKERCIGSTTKPVEPEPFNEVEENVFFPDEEDLPDFLPKNTEENNVTFPNNNDNIPEFLKGTIAAAPIPIPKEPIAPIPIAPIPIAPIPIVSKESITLGKQSKPMDLKKYYIDRLKQADPTLFNYVKKGEKGYVTHCAANVSRQPIVLDTAEYNEMREIYDDDEDLTFVVYPETTETHDFKDTKKQPSKSDNIAGALEGVPYPSVENPEVITVVRYGSNAKRLNYYMCPRLFCVRDRLLVRFKDFKAMTDRKGNPKPAYSCPFCKGTLVDEDDLKSKDRNPNKTVLERKVQPSSDSERQIYIGFLKRKTPEGGLSLPCCFIDPKGRFDSEDPEFTRLGLKSREVAKAVQVVQPIANQLLASMAPIQEPVQIQPLQIQTSKKSEYLPDYYRIFTGISKKSIVDSTKIPLEIIIPSDKSEDPKNGPQVGLLPPVLDQFFEQDSTSDQFQDRLEIVRKLKPITARGFLRVAVDNTQKNMSFFSAIAPFLGYLKTAEQTKEFIELRIRPRTFLQLNGGNLVNEFYNKCEKKNQNDLRKWGSENLGMASFEASNIPALERLMNSYECFESYLNDPTQRKDVRIFYNALSTPGILMMRGILFIILEVTVEDTIVKKGDKTEFNRDIKLDRVRCPSYPLTSKQQNADIGFLIHYTEIVRDRTAPDRKSYRNLGWEPLFYVEPAIQAVSEIQRHKHTLFFQRSEERNWPPIVQKIVSQFFNQCGSMNRGPFTSQFGMDPNALIGATELVESIRIRPSGIVRDSYNHLVGIAYIAKAGNKSEMAIVPIGDDGSIYSESTIYFDWDDATPAAADHIISFYEKYILDPFSQYRGYVPVALQRSKEENKIIGIVLKNGFIIPASDPKDPSTVTKYKIIEVDDIEWDLNRTIAYDADSRKRAFLLAGIDDPMLKDKDPIQFKLTDIKDELEDIYQHLRLTFSNWLGLSGAGRDLRNALGKVLNSNQLPLFEKRKRLDILLEGKVMSWLDPIQDDTISEIGFLRVDCTVQSKDTCTGRCKWHTESTTDSGTCKIHTPASLKESDITIPVPRMLYLRLVDELIRYASKREEIFRREVPRLTVRREKQQIGDQLIIPENTSDWNTWWEFLRSEWMTPEKEVPKFFDEQYSPIPQIQLEDPRKLPSTLESILGKSDPKTSQLVWNPSTTYEQPYLFLQSVLGRSLEITTSELTGKDLRDIAAAANVQVLYIPNEQILGRMLAKAPGATEAIILASVNGVPGWISVKGTFGVKIPLAAVPEILRQYGLK